MTTSKNYLGIDTAQATLGLSVLSWDGVEANLLEYLTFDPGDHLSDFTMNFVVCEHIYKLIHKYKVVAAGMEAPAYGYSHGMVSIGSIHGSITHALMLNKIPFVYSTPNKVKYMAAGPAKGGPWDKRQIIAKVKEIFGKMRLDSNQADSIVLSTMAFCAHQVNFSSNAKLLPTPWEQAWAQYVFLSKAKTKGRMAGILHRPNEFYWTPALAMPRATLLTNA